MENNIEEIISKIKLGEIKLYELEEKFGISEAIVIRRKYSESITNTDLSSISNIEFDPKKVYSSNCENVIGSMSLPLGIAGPIKVAGQNANGEYLIPLSTTEGALVASINRGIKIINKSGGASTFSIYHGITRAPVFRSKSIKNSFEFIKFVEQNKEVIKDIAEKTSQYIKFKGFKSFINGTSVWLRFTFDTDQAMGMNMAVKATQAIADYLVDSFEIKLIALSGNLCIDKKPALINSIEGRGREVFAETFISEDLVRKLLKCSIDEIIEVNSKKIFQGSAIAGSLGFNAHIANMIAALFLSLGQDIAHVVDASTAMTTMEKVDNKLHASVRIPSLNVATVGGGTGLLPQSKLLDMILTDTVSNNKIYSNKASALSEIIAAVCLAGELSLSAAFASNSFTKAHENLGRSK